MFKKEGTKSQGCCYCSKFKLVNDNEDIQNNNFFESKISNLKSLKKSNDNLNLIKTNKDINEFEYCPTETVIKNNEKKERIIYQFIKY